MSNEIVATFGDGSDGNITITSTIELTRDYYDNVSTTVVEEPEQQYEYAPDPRLIASQKTYNWIRKNPFFQWEYYRDQLGLGVGMVWAWITCDESYQLKCLCHALGLTRSQFIRMAILDKLSTSLQDSETLQKYTDMWAVLHKADIERAERAAKKREEKLQRKIVEDLKQQRAAEKRAAKAEEKKKRAAETAAKNLKNIAAKLGYKTRPTNVAQIIDTTITEAPQVTQYSNEPLKSEKPVRGRIIIKRV